MSRWLLIWKFLYNLVFFILEKPFFRQIFCPTWLLVSTFIYKTYHENDDVCSCWWKALIKAHCDQVHNFSNNCVYCIVIALFPANRGSNGRRRKLKKKYLYKVTKSRQLNYGLWRLGEKRELSAAFSFLGGIHCCYIEIIQHQASY